MASAKSHCLVLVASLVFFLIINPSSSEKPNQETQQLIEKICRQTEDYGFCSRTFKQNLKSPNADIVAITQITIERATENATTTLHFIRQLLQDTKDPTFKNALIACENGYLVVTQSFDGAAVSFFEKDYQSVVKEEAVTPRAEGSCEQSLPRGQNPLVEPNRQMRILITMALNSVHELLGSKIN